MISDDIRTFLSRTPVMFVLLATLWGGSFIAIEVGLHFFPPLVFAGLRYSVAGAILLGYAVVAADRWRPTGRGDWLSVGVVGLFVIAGHHAFVYLGEEYVSGAVAAVIISLSPVLTAALAAVLLDERLTPVKVGGFLLGLLGVVVVADLDPTSALSTSTVGIALVFVATVCFALGTVLVRPVRTDMPLSAMQGWAMVGGSAVLFAVGGWRGESLAAIAWTPTAIASFAYLTLLSGVIAFGIYFALLDRVGPTQLNLVGYLEPVAATLIAWWLLGDLVGAQTVAGFLAIFAGFAVLERRTLADLACRGLSGLGDRPLPDAVDSVLPSCDREEATNAWSSSREVATADD